MDPLTAYSHMRMFLPAGARIRTDVNTAGDLTFDVWSDDGIIGGEHVIGGLRCRCTLGEWWSSTEIEGQVDHVGTCGVQAGLGGLRVLAHAMARTWTRALAGRPQQVHPERMPTRGQVLLGHPADVHTIEQMAKLGHYPYKLSAYVEQGQALIIDTDALKFRPTLDVRGLLGFTGLV